MSGTVSAESRDKGVADVLDSLIISTNIYLDRIEVRGELTKTVKPKCRVERGGVTNFYEARAKIVNRNSFPFIPILTNKPNSEETIDSRVAQARDDPDSFFTAGDSPETYCFENPYRKEINRIGLPSFKRLVQTTLETNHAEKGDRHFFYIQSEDELRAMLSQLSSKRYLCIDLEHHSEHSFEGYTCLMQISSDDTDYVIDTIALNTKLEALNSLFTDPLTLKVLHGAENDILWLQRDLGIYLVGMIDTFLLARALGHRSNSLASLLQSA